MQYAKFSELLGFEHRKFSSNYLNFAPNSVIANEKAHLELITPWLTTGEKRLSLPRPIVLHHSSYAKRYLIFLNFCSVSSEEYRSFKTS